MCRNILIALVVAVVLLMAVTALVVSLYGWPGLLILLASFVVLAFILKAFGPRLFPHLLMGTITRPMRQMGRVLRGATLAVHSVTPSDAPAAMDEDEDNGEPSEPQRVRDRADPDDEDDDASEDEDDEHEDAEPAAADLAWYWIDFTVTPRDAGSSAGRMVRQTAWQPGLLSFHLTREDRPPRPAGLPAFFEAFGSPEVQMADIETWSGTAFEQDAEAEVFGAGRAPGPGRDRPKNRDRVADVCPLY